MENIITDETLAYVAVLAKLELSEEETRTAKKDMESMLAYIDQLNELDTEQVEPLSHTFQTVNVFREDIVTNTDGREDTLANAPQSNQDSFAVPKTFV